MAYQLKADDGTLLDAHFDVEGDSFVFHSRGGGKGSKALNPDYSAALRLLLERLQLAGEPVQRAWVDSGPVQKLPIDGRTILAPHEVNEPAANLVRLMAGRMQLVGKSPASKGGNATKRIRLVLTKGTVAELLLTVLRAVPSPKDLRSLERLPAAQLLMVNAEHLWRAVQRLEADLKDHGFGESTDFDVLLENGVRVPPKAVFGLAASEALGIKVEPKHFSAGEGTPCFRMLTEAGYQIVAKVSHELAPQPLPEEFDREWIEGTPRWRKHLRRERAAGLREAKKTQFRRLHGGKLFCEQCREDLVSKYSTEEADACIEVHHSKILLSEMKEAHATKLEHLQCLCANCHRLEHRRLKMQTE